MIAPPFSPIDRRQAHLLILAGFFLTFQAVALTVAPAVRARSWQVDLNWLHWLGLVAWVGVFTLLHHQTARYLPERDPFLLPVAAILVGWGILSIFRLSPGFGLRQSAWLVVSGGIMLLGIRRIHLLIRVRKYKYIWLTGGLGLTALTLIFGTNPLGYGPRLWLGCCGVYLQPSEPLKLLLIIYLAAFLADRQLLLGTMSEKTPSRLRVSLLPVLAPTLLAASVALLLMAVQRDLGTASIFLFLYAAVVYLAAGNWRFLVLSVSAIGAAGIAGYLLFDVVRLRIEAWIYPWNDPSGRSYQIVQSLLAVANGGIFGRGPGLGSPGLVPVAHSDFIFASMAEEFGLAGGLALLGLAAVLALRGMQTALHAPDLFRRLLAAGFTAYLVGQTVLIIGGNIRLLPLTGVTLPFVSYGGSSLVTSFLALLTLLWISEEARTDHLVAFETRPYWQLFLFLITGLGATAVLLGWWSVLRGPDLLTRTDNARRSISDRFVRRGSLLDRSFVPLAETTGSPGSYARTVQYAALSPVIGYTHPVYGQSGLEASLDNWLRGLTGYPDWFILSQDLLYGQPPPGLDLRLTLDLELQQIADDQLAGQIGALVLLDANNGDILVMSSHPSFDANQLDQDWSSLVTDPTAPFLNRAILGQYPPGALFGPLLLAAALDQNQTLPQPGESGLTLGSTNYTCATALELTPGEATLPAYIAAGCPGANQLLGERLGADELLQLFQRAGIFEAPQVSLPVLNTQAPQSLADAGLGALGLEAETFSPYVRISPLQAALALAPLSSGGTTPEERLLLAVNTPSQGWVVEPAAAENLQVISPQSANAAAQALTASDQLTWQSLGVGWESGAAPQFTWFAGGTLPDWPGAPLVVVVLLEEAAPNQASLIGNQMLQAAMQP